MMVATAPSTMFRAATEEFDPNTVTPGMVGFLITFLIGIITVLLVIDMVRRIRRTNYRADVRKRLDAEAAEKHTVKKSEQGGRRL
jgi:hypothetical protein